MIRLFLVLFLISQTVILLAENPSLNYIAQYKQIAVLEMQRTGIPASIKMAQALLESGAGRSTLATQANNHFGIKCGGEWSGETYYREDDDYRNGKLIKSCFRKFGSVYDSFMAHSDFLVGQNRYQFLFDIPEYDYKSWAKGLRKAGYATDKAYSQKLIDIIEKYELYHLDKLHSYEEGEFLAEAENNQVETKGTVIVRKTKKQDSREGELADSEESPSRDTRKYSPVYYENATTHMVEDGERLADIARLYEIDETALRLRNRLPKDAEPLPGEEIHLRKKISLLNRPEFVRQVEGSMASADAEFIF